MPRQEEHRAPAQGAAEGTRPSIDADIDDSVRGSPAWREKEDLLASVPGIGTIIARTLIADCPNSAARPQQIAALAGLAPFTRQSGQWRGRSFIGGGRPRAQRPLHGRAGRPRHNPVSEAFLDGSFAAGKPKWSPSSPSPESSSPSSTPFSGTKSHGKPLDIQHSRSRSCCVSRARRRTFRRKNGSGANRSRGCLILLNRTVDARSPALTAFGRSRWTIWEPTPCASFRLV